MQQRFLLQILLLAQHVSGHHYAHHHELKRNKMPTRCNRGFYCRSYCLLNMFRGTTMHIIMSSREIKCQLDATEVFIADLIACSTCFGHHYAHYQELKGIIQWLLPVVFRAVVFKLLVWCGPEGYVSGLQDAAESC